VCSAILVSNLKTLPLKCGNAFISKDKTQAKGVKFTQLNYSFSFAEGTKTRSRAAEESYSAKLSLHHHNRVHANFCTSSMTLFLHYFFFSSIILEISAHFLNLEISDHFTSHSAIKSIS